MNTKRGHVSLKHVPQGKFVMLRLVYSPSWIHLSKCQVLLHPFQRLGWGTGNGTIWQSTHPVRLPVSLICVALSCTVFDMLRDIGRKSPILPTILYLAPLEFQQDLLACQKLGPGLKLLVTQTSGDLCKWSSKACSHRRDRTGLKCTGFEHVQNCELPQSSSVLSRRCERTLSHDAHPFPTRRTTAFSTVIEYSPNYSAICCTVPRSTLLLHLTRKAVVGINRRQMHAVMTLQLLRIAGKSMT